MAPSRSRTFGIGILATLAGCQQATWKGWIYPDGSNLTRSVPIGAFDTLEQCRLSATALLGTIQLQGPDGERITGDYECGLNCKAENTPGGLNVCDETAR
jgi:hypothetical protein